MQTKNDLREKDACVESDMALFYNATGATTNGYLARAVVNTILRGDLGTDNFPDGEESCKVS